MKRWMLWLLVFCLSLSGCAQTETEQPWWYEPIHAVALAESGLRGDGVLVAILDSGVDQTCAQLSDAKLLADEMVADPVGHGTFITATVYRLMPEATYLPIPITDSATDISVSQITDGLEQAIEAKADVAILSLGMQEDVPELRQAVEALAETGCLIFAAVGNDGTDALYYPAAYPCVVGVGACNLACHPSETSQYNESVYVLAPGVKLTGSWLGGQERTLKGTSYAVPFAAAMGIAAKSVNPALSPEDFMDLLQDCTTDCGEPGYDVESGWGIIDFQKLCQKLRS